MMAGCPDRDEVARFLDGELTENRAGLVRAHLAGCAVCARAAEAERRLLADLAAPPTDVATSRLVAAVVNRLDDAPARRPSRMQAVGGFALVGAAAACLFFVGSKGLGTEEPDPGTFRARGFHDGSLARRAGVEILLVGPPTRKLAARDQVTSDARYVAAYRNLDPASPAYLLAFAVDAAGAVHWLYPAHLSAASDPPAVELGPAARPTAMADVVALDHPARGPLRVVTILSPRRANVSSIEGATPTELRREALAARFPGSVVDETTIEVVASNEDGRP